jgi:preprotein translocase subunit SecY
MTKVKAIVSNKISLNRRMLLSVIVLLVIFLTLTATVLNRINLKSSEQALRENLNTQLYALLSAADVELNNINLRIDLPSTQ